MNLNYDDLRAALIRDEALRLKPYLDTVGKTTIGVGRNLTDVGISEDEAQLMLGNDIARTIGQLEEALSWVEKLDEVRSGVLANMCFNMGIVKFLGFHNTLSLVEAGEYDKAADAMLASKWAGQVGARATRLAQEMRTGVAVARP